MNYQSFITTVPIMPRKISSIIRSLNNKDGDYFLDKKKYKKKYIREFVDSDVSILLKYYFNKAGILHKEISSGLEDICMGYYIDKDGVIREQLN